MIIVNMTEKEWKECKKMDSWGGESLEKEGFLHASDVESFSLVVPKLLKKKDPMVLIFIDERKLNAPVKYEDLKSKGIKFPHIYGQVNKDSILFTAPLVIDEKGEWKHSEEIESLVKGSI